VQAKLERFEESNGGKVFLHEVEGLTPSPQAKLLRFLQRCELEGPGETITKQLDVRIIAVTNVDLSEAVAAGKLREDLF